MRTPPLVLIVLSLACLLSACKKQPFKPAINLIPIESPLFDFISGSDNDSVNISTDTATKTMYAKAELRKVLKYYPELYEEYAYHPDITYNVGTRNMAALKPNDYVGCELCQDSYYELYAYFLYMRNCGEQHHLEREKLIKLYKDINDICGRLAGWGTYYSHQRTRIRAYAEYAIYQGFDSKTGKPYYYSERAYNIKAQKALYIASLKQKITDEVNNNYDQFLPKQRPAAFKELFKTVDEIDGLITNYFYLSKIMEFQYSNY